MNMNIVWFLAIFELALFQAAFGCGGYTLNITKLTPCGDDNVITVSDDFGVILDEHCNVYITGCVHVTKTIEVAKAKYSLNKQPLPLLEGTLDLCELAEKYGPLVAEPLKKMGIPTKCPIEKMDLCGSPDKSYNIAKFKNQLGMGKGDSDLRLEVDHGEAGKTCMEIGVTISKPRMSPKKIRKTKIVNKE